MEPESQIVSASPSPMPSSPTPNRQLVAPVWTTIALLVLFLGNSYFSATHRPAMNEGPLPERILILQYGITIAFEFLLLGLVWFGLKRKGMKLRDLIGGRWETPEDFLLDIAIAVGFFLLSYGILALLGYALGLAGPSQLKETKKLADMLAPQSGASMAVFILVSCTAGLVEEIIFRGHLQRQISAISGNVYVGLILSAILFGLAHGYEGTRRMVLIAVLGAMFGVLALLRKSLRPGMMAHALFDSLQGVVLWLLRKGVIPMR